MPARTPWAVKLLEILTPEEGEEPEWVSFQDILDVTVPLIPEERALRHLVVKPRFTNTYAARRDLVSMVVQSLTLSHTVEIELDNRRLDRVKLTEKGLLGKSSPRQTAHPWTLKILEILANKEWHDYEAVMEEAAPLVPPGMAWRQAEENRVTYYSRRRVPTGERVRGDRNDTIKTGQRYYVSRGIRSLRTSGRIEVEYGGQAVKKRPTRLRLKL